MTVEKPILWTWRGQVIDDLNFRKMNRTSAEASRFVAGPPRVSRTWRSRMSERRHVRCACAIEQSLFHTVS